MSLPLGLGLGLGQTQYMEAMRPLAARKVCGRGHTSPSLFLQSRRRRSCNQNRRPCCSRLSTAATVLAILGCLCAAPASSIHHSNKHNGFLAAGVSGVGDGIGAPSFGVAAAPPPPPSAPKDDPNTQVSTDFKTPGAWGSLRRNKTVENVQVSMEMEPEPRVSAVRPSKGPFYGNVPVEIRGSHFGKFQMTQRAFVGERECVSTIWRAEDHLTCIVPPGTGQKLEVTVKVLSSNGKDSSSGSSSSSSPDSTFTVVGSSSGGVFDSDEDSPLFSYVESNPTINQIVPNEGAVRGGERVEIFGVNLGTPDLPPEILICDKSCTPVEWVDSEHVLCVTPPNIAGKECPVRMNLGAGPVMLTPGLTFKYTETAVKKVAPLHGPTYGNTTIHIYGTGLGNVLSPPSVFLGPWPCQAITFVSSSHIVCTSSAASPGVVPVRISLNGVDVVGGVDPSTGCPAEPCGAAWEFHYEPPVVESVTPSVVSVFGNDTVSIYGRNLGFQFLAADHPQSREVIDAYALDYPAARVTINGLPCLQTTQVSESHVQCTTPPLPTGSYSVVVTVLDQPSRHCPGGSRAACDCPACITYHAPVVSTAYPLRGPTYGGFEIFVHGRMFGPRPLSQVVFLGSRPCNQTRWISSAELACLVPSAISAGPARVTVASSLHLGHEDYEIKSGPDGRALTLGTHDEATSAFVTFEPPRVTRVLPSEGATAGGNIITVSGLHFGRWSHLTHPKQGAGQDRGAPRVLVGDAECRDVKVLPTSDLTSTDSVAAVTCVAPPNAPGSQPVSVLVSQMTESTRPRNPCSGPDISRMLVNGVTPACSLYTYQGPYVDAVRPSFGPFYGGSTVTVTGRNFGRVQQVVHVHVGGLPCGSVKRVDENTVTCKTPPSSPGRASVDVVVSHASLGAGNNIPSSYSSPAQVGTSGGRLAFVYEGPTINRIIPSFGAANGGARVTIFGANFGGPDAAPADRLTHVYFGAAPCLDVTVVDATEITCTAPMPPPLSVDSAAGSSVAAAGMGEAYGALADPTRPFVSRTSPRHGQPSNLALTVPVRVVVGGESSRTDYQDGDAHHLPGRMVGRDTPVPSVKPEDTPTPHVNSLYIYHGPQIRSVEPSVGAVFGGDTVTITGHFFSPPAATQKDESGGGGPAAKLLPHPVVYFDDAFECGQVQVLSDSLLTCVAPAVDKPLTATLRVSLAGLSSSSVGYSIQLRAELERLYVTRSSTHVVTRTAPRNAATVALLSEPNPSASTSRPAQAATLHLVHLPGGYDLIQSVYHRAVVEEQTHLKSLRASTIAPSIVDAACCCCAFRYRFEAPVVQFVTPDHVSSAGGDVITIKGRHFSYSETRINEKAKPKPLSSWRSAAATAQVMVGNVACVDLKIVSPTELHCRPSAQAPGYKPMDVFILGYKATSAARALAAARDGSSTSSLRTDNEMKAFPGSDLLEGGVERRPGKSAASIDTEEAKMPQLLVVGPAARVVIPNTGSFLGGQVVTILGSGFGQPGGSRLPGTLKPASAGGGLTVFFGNAECSPVIHVSPTELQCVTQRSEVGEQRVTVYSSGYSNAEASTATFNYEGPFISHIMPPEGPSYGGTAVTIVGRNLGRPSDSFGSQVVVEVGGRPCLEVFWNNHDDQLRRWSPLDKTPRKPDPTSLVCVTPYGAGVAEVVVRSHGVLAVSDVSSALSFEYKPPQIRQLVPASGPAHGHTHVRVYGSNFGWGALNPTVYIGGQRCLATVFISSSELECLSPPANVTTGSFGTDVAAVGGALVAEVGCQTVSKIGRKFHVAVAVMDAVLSEAADTSGLAPGHRGRLTAGSTFSVSESDDEDLRDTRVLEGGLTSTFLYEPLVLSSVSPSQCSLSSVLKGDCVMQLHGRNLGVAHPGQNDAILPIVTVGAGTPCSNVVIRSSTIVECVVGVPPSLVLSREEVEADRDGAAAASETPENPTDSTSLLTEPVKVTAVSVPAVTLTKTSECSQTRSTLVDVHQTTFGCGSGTTTLTKATACSVSNPSCCRTRIDASASIEFSFETSGEATVHPVEGGFGGQYDVTVELKAPLQFDSAARYSVYFRAPAGGGGGGAKCGRPRIEGGLLKCKAPNILSLGLPDWSTSSMFVVDVDVYAQHMAPGAVATGFVKLASCSKCFSFTAPRAVSVTPSSGSVCGGDYISVHGADFVVPAGSQTHALAVPGSVPAAKPPSELLRMEVWIGSQLCSDVVVQNSTLLTCRTPGAAVGSAEVNVRAAQATAPVSTFEESLTWLRKNTICRNNEAIFQYQRAVIHAVVPGSVPVYGATPLYALGQNLGAVVPRGKASDNKVGGSANFGASSPKCDVKVIVGGVMCPSPRIVPLDKDLFTNGALSNLDPVVSYARAKREHWAQIVCHAPPHTIVGSKKVFVLVGGTFAVSAADEAKRAMLEDAVPAIASQLHSEAHTGSSTSDNGSSENETATTDRPANGAASASAGPNNATAAPVGAVTTTTRSAKLGNNAGYKIPKYVGAIPRTIIPVGASASPGLLGSKFFSDLAGRAEGDELLEIQSFGTLASMDDTAALSPASADTTSTPVYPTSPAGQVVYLGPHVSSVTPSEGLLNAATPLAITGQFFGKASMALPVVTVGATKCRSVKRLNESFLTCVLPAHLEQIAGSDADNDPSREAFRVAVEVTGTAKSFGEVHFFRVSSADASASGLSDQQKGGSVPLFTVPRPYVSSVAPSKGSLFGGTQISIQGEHFLAAAGLTAAARIAPRLPSAPKSDLAVFVGDQLCGDLRILSDTKLVCTVPAFLSKAVPPPQTPGASSPDTTCSLQWIDPTKKSSELEVAVRMAVGGVLSASDPATDAAEDLDDGTGTPGGGLNSPLPPGTTSFRYLSTPPVNILSESGHIFGGYSLTLSGGLPLLHGASSPAIKALQTPSLRVYVGGNLCKITAVTPSTEDQPAALNCTVPVHVPGATMVRVLAMGFMIDAQQFFTYEGPEITSIWPRSGFADKAHKLNITGRNFLPHAATIAELFGPAKAADILASGMAWFQVRVGTEVCRNVTVLSDTHLQCIYPGPLARISLDAAETLMNKTLQRSLTFSYTAPNPPPSLPVFVELGDLCHSEQEDEAATSFQLQSPLVTSVDPEGGDIVRPYGGGNLYLRGTDLTAHVDAHSTGDYTVFIDHLPCKATEFIRRDVIRCIGVPSLLRPTNASVSVGFRARPAAPRPADGPNRTGSEAGANYSAASVVEESQRQMFAAEENLVVVHQPNVSIDVRGFSVSSVSPAVGTPGITITVTGNGFPTPDTTPDLVERVKVTIGSRACESARVVDDSNIVCEGVPEGSGNNLVVTVFVAGIPTIPNITDADEPMAARQGKMPFFSYTPPMVASIAASQEVLDVSGGSELSFSVHGLSSTSMAGGVQNFSVPISSSDPNMMLLWAHEELDVGDWPIVVSASTGAMKACVMDSDRGDGAASFNAEDDGGARHITCRAGPGWGKAYVTLLPSGVVEALLSASANDIFGNGGSVHAWDAARREPKQKSLSLVGSDAATKLAADQSATLAALKTLVDSGSSGTGAIVEMEYGAPELTSIDAVETTLLRKGGSTIVVRGRNFGAPIDVPLDRLAELRQLLESGLPRLPTALLSAAIRDLLGVLDIARLRSIVEHHGWQALPISYSATREYQMNVDALNRVRVVPRPLSDVTPPVTPLCGNVSAYNESTPMWQQQYRLASSTFHGLKVYKQKVNAASCQLWAQISLGASEESSAAAAAAVAAVQKAKSKSLAPDPEFLAEQSATLRVVRQTVAGRKALAHLNAARYNMVHSRHHRDAFCGTSTPSSPASQSNASISSGNETMTGSEATAAFLSMWEQETVPRLMLNTDKKSKGRIATHGGRRLLMAPSQKVLDNRVADSLMFLQQHASLAERDHQRRVWPGQGVDPARFTTTASPSALPGDGINTDGPTTDGYVVSESTTSSPAINVGAVSTAPSLALPASTSQIETTLPETSLPDTTTPESFTTVSSQLNETDVTTTTSLIVSQPPAAVVEDLPPLVPVDNRYYSDGVLVTVGGRACSINTLAVTEVYCRAPPGSSAAAATAFSVDAFDVGTGAAPLAYARPKIVQVFPAAALPGDKIYVVIPGPSADASYTYDELGVTIGGAPCQDVQQWGTGDDSGGSPGSTRTDVRAALGKFTSRNFLVLECRVPRAFTSPPRLADAPIPAANYHSWYGLDPTKPLQEYPPKSNTSKTSTTAGAGNVAVVALIDGQTSTPWRKFKYSAPNLVDALVVPSHGQTFESIIDLLLFMEDTSRRPDIDNEGVDSMPSFAGPSSANSGAAAQEVVASKMDYVLFLGRGLKPFTTASHDALSSGGHVVDEALARAASAAPVSLSIGQAGQPVTGLGQRGYQWAKSACLPAVTAVDFLDVGGGGDGASSKLQNAFNRLLQQYRRALVATPANPFDLVACQVPSGQGTQLPMSVSVGTQHNVVMAEGARRIVFSFKPPYLGHVAVFRPSDFVDVTAADNDDGAQEKVNDIGPASGMHIIAVGRGFGELRKTPAAAAFPNKVAGASNEEFGVLQMFVNDVPALNVRRFTFEQMLDAVGHRPHPTSNTSATNASLPLPIDSSVGGEDMQIPLLRWVKTHFRNAAQEMLGPGNAWVNAEWAHAFLPPLPAVADGDLAVYVRVGQQVSNTLHTPQLHLRVSGPVVSSISPAVARAGDTVVITGSNFGGMAPAAAGRKLVVSFQPAQGAAGHEVTSSRVTWVSDHTIQAEVPEGVGRNLVVRVDVADSGGAGANASSVAHSNSASIATFSFESPTITHVALLRGPSGTASERVTDGSPVGELRVSAGDSLLISGRGFGPLSEPVQAFISTALCASTERVGLGQIRCVVGPGHGLHLALRVRVGDMTSVAAPGTISAPFRLTKVSYLSPRVDSVLPSEIPAAGGVLLTIRGANFEAHTCGNENDDAANQFVLSVGLHPCPVISCPTNDTVVCRAPAGVGRDNRVLAWVPTDDENVLLNSSTSQVPPAAGSPSLLVQQRQMMGYAQVPESLDVPRVTVSYQPPCVTAVRLASSSNASDGPRHRPVQLDEGDVIDIVGLNFGAADVAPLAVVGGRACTQTVWIDDALIRCTVPTAHRVANSSLVDALDGLSNNSLPSPKLRGGALTKLQRSGNRSSSSDALPVAVLVAGQQSGSALCSGLPLGTEGTVMFRPPVVELVRPTFVSPRGGSIQIKGRNFGAPGDDVSVFIDDRKCSDAIVVAVAVSGREGAASSEHVIQCVTPAGFGHGHTVVAMVAGHTSTPRRILNYGLPTVREVRVIDGLNGRAMSRASSSSSGDLDVTISEERSTILITVDGTTIPSAGSIQDPEQNPDSFVRVWVGDHQCTNVSLVADWVERADNQSRIACNAPPGHGRHVRVLVTVGIPDEPQQILSPTYLGEGIPLLELARASGFVNFAGPAVHSVSPRIGSETGETQITVRGGSFLAQHNINSSSSSPEQQMLRVFVGAAPCVGVEVLSDTEATCLAPPGLGTCVPVSATFEDAIPIQPAAGTTTAALNKAALAKFSYVQESRLTNSSTAAATTNATLSLDSVVADSLLLAVDEGNEAALLLRKSSETSAGPPKSRFSLALACPRDCADCVATARIMADVAQRLQCFDIVLGAVTSESLQKRYRSMVGAEGWPVLAFQYNEAPTEYLGPLTAGDIFTWTVGMMQRVEGLARAHLQDGNSSHFSEALGAIFLRQPQSHGVRQPLYNQNCSSQL